MKNVGYLYNIYISRVDFENQSIYLDYLQTWIMLFFLLLVAILLFMFLLMIIDYFRNLKNRCRK